MDYVAIVEKSIEAIERGDVDRINEYLSDELVYRGVLLGELGKQEFIEMMKALANAMPDLSFNHEITLVTGTQVMLMIQVTATHTKDLYLPFPGMPAIEASHKRITMPQETLWFTFDGDRVSEIYVEPVAGGGLGGLLAHLGIEVPPSGSGEV